MRAFLGWFMLSVTFEGSGATVMHKILRDTMVLEFGAVGRKAALPLIDLKDGRWLLRFVARQTPPLVNTEGLELIVRPAPGSILRVEAQLQPMRSHVGMIPIMQRIVALQFVSEPHTSNRGMLG
jgi:hypothetical protein